MIVMMLSRLGQTLSRLLPRSGLAGDGLMRIRNTSIAMLALVAAIGLGLVVFVSQQGWPGVLSGPIPDSPVKLGVVHNDPIVLAQVAPDGRGEQERERARRTTGNGAPRRSGGGQAVRAGLDPSRQIQGAPAAAPNLPTQPPTPTPVPVSPPASQPPATPPASTPVSAPASAVDGSSTLTSSEKGKGTYSGGSKGGSSTGSKGSSAEKAKSSVPSGDKDQSPVRSKSEEPAKTTKSPSSPKSAEQDVKSEAPPPPPPPVSPAKDGSEKDKEAGYPGEGYGADKDD